MRVVLITESDLSGARPVGGAETSMMLLARRLAARGHEVAFVHELADRRLLPGTVHEEREGVLIAGIRPVKEFRAARRVHRINRFRKRLNRRHTMRVLRRLVIDAQADIVYSYYQLDAMAWIAELLGEASPAKWVLRIAGLYPIRHIERVPTTLPRYRRLLERVDCLNYNHADLQGLFEDEAAAIGLNLPACPLLIGDIGVDLPPTRPRPLDRDPADPMRLVMVARFSPHQKRQDLLVRALHQMTRPVQLTFVGEGTERPAIESLVADLGLSDRVTFRSQLPQQELWELLAGFDLLCVATDYEGLSKITVEAMAIGLPVVASAVPPVTGLLEHERTGFLVGNDASAWARELDRLALDRDLRNRVAAMARSFVEAEYDASQQVLMYEREFAALLDG